MTAFGVASIIIAAVLSIEGLTLLTRKQVRKRRRSKRFAQLLDGGSSLLPSPSGYESLQALSKRKDGDVQGLEVGARIGHGSYGIVYHGTSYLRLLHLFRAH